MPVETRALNQVLRDNREKSHTRPCGPPSPFSSIMERENPPLPLPPTPFRAPTGAPTGYFGLQAGSLPYTLPPAPCGDLRRGPSAGTSRVRCREAKPLDSASLSNSAWHGKRFIAKHVGCNFRTTGEEVRSGG
jgi:hypothetical protein